MKIILLIKIKIIIIIIITTTTRTTKKIIQHEEQTQLLLIFNIHHIASDGWSNNIFYKEMNLFYDYAYF